MWSRRSPARIEPVPALRFFFYGTLIAGSGNLVARAVHDRLVCLGPARTRGTLWAIPDARGWYPALRPGNGWVHGRFYETTSGFDARDEARLDGWEECRRKARKQSSYWRQPAIVLAGKARRRAGLYLYNRKLPSGARRISGGDFAAWLAAHGFTAYGA